MDRKLLAVIGLVIFMAGGAITYKATALLSEFDPEAVGVYTDFASQLLESKDPGVPMVYSLPVEEGITPDEVKKSLQSLARQHNVLYTGENPFYKQLEARSGKPHRYINFLSFCHPQSGEVVLDYKDIYSAFMPSRIAIVEDKSGKLWLHTMRLDLMIYGGRPLPPELKKEALHVWNSTREIMQGAAAGDF